MESVIGGTFTAFSPPPMSGLSPDEISALPSSAYKESEEAKKEERCPICLDDVRMPPHLLSTPMLINRFGLDSMKIPLR